MGDYSGATKIYLYIDGVSQGSATWNTYEQNITAYWRMGAYAMCNGACGWTSGSSGYYAGTMDEVRVTPGLLSADWVKTEYNNINSPSTFYSMGNQQSR